MISPSQRSRKLLGVTGPHYMVVLFGTQGTCARGICVYIRQHLPYAIVESSKTFI